MTHEHLCPICGEHLFVGYLMDWCDCGYERRYTVPSRVDILKARLKASEASASKKHYKQRIEALKAEIARLEPPRADT